MAVLHEEMVVVEYFFQFWDLLNDIFYHCINLIESIFY